MASDERSCRRSRSLYGGKSSRSEHSLTADVGRLNHAIPQTAAGYDHPESKCGNIGIFRLLRFQRSLVGLPPGRWKEMVSKLGRCGHGSGYPYGSTLARCFQTDTNSDCISTSSGFLALHPILPTAWSCVWHGWESI